MAASSLFETLIMSYQPILTSEREIGFFELFLRNKRSHVSLAGSKDAINQNLINICFAVSELKDKLHAPLSVKLTSTMLMSDSLFPIKPDLIYIELPGNTPITHSSIAALKAWRKAGYRFILSGFRFDLDYRHILPFIHMVKMDANKLIEHKHHLERLKTSDLPIIVRKVNDKKVYNTCKQLGASLFQGDFLKELEQLDIKGPSAEMQSAKQILNEIKGDSGNIDKITRLISDNPYLSYQLLRVLNNPISGLPRKVTDIREVIIMLGLAQIKKWAYLISTSATKKHQYAVFDFIINRPTKSLQK